VPFDDDAEADHTGYRPPPHPDDRLWRHPSELRDHPIVPMSDPLHGTSGAPVPPTARGRARWRNRWVVAGGGALAGALVTGVAVATLGVGQEVVERPVTERVALEPDADLGAADAGSPDAGRAPADAGAATGDGAAEPAVVTVGPAGRGAATAEGAPADGTPAGSVSSAGGPQGTGVVVRDDGIVVTSDALVSGGASPVVRLADGTRPAADIVGTDPVTGIAVLDLDGGGYTPSVLADGPGPAAGEAAFAVTAAPDGGTATGEGLVGPARRYVGPTGTGLEGIEITGAADTAALGGPVVDRRGAVVGIVTGVDPGGAWYAAPLDVARRVTDELLATGVAHHSWLGIEGANPTASEATPEAVAAPPDPTVPDAVAPGSATDTPGGIDTYAGAPLAAPDGGGDVGQDANAGAGAYVGGDGTLVASVVADSPADDGGIEVGDRIVAIGERRIADMAALLVALRAHGPGDRVEVTVARPDGAQVTLVIRLREAPGDPGG
jgi:S1-C subfamily serine protease